MSATDAALRLLAAVPTPSPTPTGPPADLVTPGPWGFAIFLGVAVITGLLIWDMSRRVRRVRYREEVRQKLDAESAAEQPHGDSRTPPQ